jgi:hypothetical protein
MIKNINPRDIKKNLKSKDFGMNIKGRGDSTHPSSSLTEDSIPYNANRPPLITFII